MNSILEQETINPLYSLNHQLENGNISQLHLSRSLAVDGVLASAKILDSSFGVLMTVNYRFEDCAFVSVRIDAAEIARTTFEHCYFENVDFRSIVARDVLFDRCVFANCNLSVNEEMGALSIRFVECVVGSSASIVQLSELEPARFSNTLFLNHIPTTLPEGSLGWTAPAPKEAVLAPAPARSEKALELPKPSLPAPQGRFSKIEIE